MVVLALTFRRMPRSPQRVHRTVLGFLRARRTFPQRLSTRAAKVYRALDMYARMRLLPLGLGNRYATYLHGQQPAVGQAPQLGDCKVTVYFSALA